ncbi:hypothetical protein BVX97_01030, partial [bacterium E08(2017)]
MKEKKSKIVCIIFTATVIMSMTGIADTVWTGTASDNIADASYWNPAVLPTNSGNVGTMASDAFWASGNNILTNFYLDIQGGTIENDGIANTYNFDGGEVTLNGGQLDSKDSVVLEGGAVLTVNSGSLNTSREHLSINNGAAIINGGLLETSGLLMADN